MPHTIMHIDMRAPRRYLFKGFVGSGGGMHVTGGGGAGGGGASSVVCGMLQQVLEAAARAQAQHSTHPGVRAATIFLLRHGIVMLDARAGVAELARALPLIMAGRDTDFVTLLNQVSAQGRVM